MNRFFDKNISKFDSVVENGYNMLVFIYESKDRLTDLIYMEAKQT
jgi:hypothetical protein